VYEAGSPTTDDEYYDYMEKLAAKKAKDWG